MSLHIVSNEDFVPEPELDIEHDDFLLDRVRDIASDSVYRFQDVSTTCDVFEQAFGVDLAERSVGDLLRRLGFRRLSVRPQHPASDPQAQAAHKKLRRAGLRRHP